MAPHIEAPLQYLKEGVTSGELAISVGKIRLDGPGEISRDKMLELLQPICAESEANNGVSNRKRPEAKFIVVDNTMYVFQTYLRNSYEVPHVHMYEWLLKKDPEGRLRAAGRLYLDSREIDSDASTLIDKGGIGPDSAKLPIGVSNAFIQTRIVPIMHKLVNLYQI
jgi:hypothetical protein